MFTSARLLLLAVGLLSIVLPAAALCIPVAEHVRINLLAQRMNVNDYSIRKQIRAELNISTEDHRSLEDLEAARLIVTSPGGITARVRPYRIRRQGKRFKTARAEVVFKLAEDTASKQRSNVPTGYFAGDGPYRVRIDLPRESFRGQVRFGDPIALHVSQGGTPQHDFSLDAAQPIELTTVPQSFGPVYYKHRDLSNLFYQLANMEDSLLQRDFDAEEESPQYFFQLRAGPIGSEQTQLIEPPAYIAGAQPHLIRADQAVSPMLLPGGALNPGLNLLIDFSRKEVREDGLFSPGNDHFSQHIVVKERVVYAFELYGAAP